MQIHADGVREMEPTREPGADSRHRVVVAMQAEGETLHELDYEDLGLTAAGLRLVRRAATAVLRLFSCVEEDEVPAARGLALFLDHVFWDERTGGLILCADFPDRSFCLPIPRGCWGLKPQLARVQ